MLPKSVSFEEGPGVDEDGLRAVCIVAGPLRIGVCSAHDAIKLKVCRKCLAAAEHVLLLQHTQSQLIGVSDAQSFLALYHERERLEAVVATEKNRRLALLYEEKNVRVEHRHENMSEPRVVCSDIRPSCPKSVRRGNLFTW